MRPTSPPPAQGPDMLSLGRFSFGIGDRFAHQARAQLAAFVRLKQRGIDVVPVWNKSNREHTFIGSHPDEVRAAAAAAIADSGWTDPWHVDADHIRIETVDRFLESSDFFTIDVADSIGQDPGAAALEAFLKRHPELIGSLAIDGIERPFVLTVEEVARIARKYLAATAEAGRIFRHIATAKGGADRFIAEVSMDETDAPQTPPELLVILAALADEQVRVQTIAPKFTGRFNKGVDYVGDLAAFEREFDEDLAVIAHAIRVYGLPANLKTSIHSGSDKFSLYPIVRRACARSGAGFHLKTAGTTWLEEIIGLAEAGGAGLDLAREIYAYAFEHVDEFCAPYASVIDIDVRRLPKPAELSAWDGPRLAEAVRHVPSNPRFDANVRQLLHVSFKVAAKHGRRYLDLLEANAEIVGRQVTENLYDRHMVPLFLD